MVKDQLDYMELAENLETLLIYQVRLVQQVFV